jgi:hypothetical protein
MGKREKNMDIKFNRKITKCPTTQTRNRIATEQVCPVAVKGSVQQD